MNELNATHRRIKTATVVPCDENQTEIGSLKSHKIPSLSPTKIPNSNIIFSAA